MAKLYRVVSYVLDLNGDSPTIKAVTRAIEHNSYPEFHRVEEVLETDCGEWDDDHELNQTGAPYAKYFPDVDPGPLDANLKTEYRRVRQIILQLIDENGALKRQTLRDQEELAKLKKVQEFVKTIGELTK